MYYGISGRVVITLWVIIGFYREEKDFMEEAILKFSLKDK